MASKAAAKQKKKGGGGGCPYASSEGYTTNSGRNDWINTNNSGKKIDIPVSLEADLNPDKPLYYWQIYSLTGPKPLKDIVTRFYAKVYNDEENPSFKFAFSRIR